MEKILNQSPAAKNQDEKLNVNSDLYDAAIVSVKNEVSELINEERSKKNLTVEDTQLLKNCESPVFFKESTEKVSPTLLESAFKVMKTLFSPEKAKNKTANSVNQQKSVLESSSSSFHLLNKQKMIITEPENEIHVIKSPLPEENDLKDKKQLTIPMLSPLTFDLQSNDDDSFLTTISYDESFQSAVTHFDENGEVAKTCDNLPNSVFNSSQDLDLVESCNSSMENSECCLENTMLKNDSNCSKEINHIGFSYNGNNDQNKDFDPKNNELPNANCSYQAYGVQVEVFKADDIDSYTQAGNKLITKISDLNGISNEVNFHNSEINSEGMVLKKENQIPDQITEPGFQHLVTVPQSTHCLSSNAECVRAVQENKVSCTENLNWDFVEMENTETGDKLKITGEKSVLRNSFGSPTPHLSKSDLNEIDEMLIALKNDSGTVTSNNSFNRNYVVYTGTGSSYYMKSPEFIYTNQKSTKSKENTKPEKPMSSGSGRSDKSKKFSHHRISDKSTDKSGVFNEAKSSLIFSLNKETEKQIESPKQYQNQQKLNDTSNFNTSQKKVNANNNEELNFENNVTHSAEVSTALYPREKTVGSPHRVPVRKSLNVSPLTATNTEVVENDDGFETTKIFVGEGDNRFSLKHSTPVSVLHNHSSFCSSNQKLNVNSLEINEGSDGNKTISELHNASSDFLSKAMGIFFEPSNPSVSAESICSVGLIMSPKPSEESNVSPVTSEFNRLQRTRTQILKEKSESPTSSRVSLVSEVKDYSKGQKEGFEKKLELSECDQPLDKKSERFSSEKSDLNITVEVRDSVKLNKIKNLEVSSIGNRVNSKARNNEEPDALNLTFNKMTDTKSEKNKPLPFNEVNDTYDKESNTGNHSGCDVNDVNKIPEKSFTSGLISEKERSGFSEYQETENFSPSIKEPTEPMRQTFSITANESLTGNTDGNKNTDSVYVNNENHSFLSESFSLSPSSGNSSLQKNQAPASSNQVTENLSGKPKGRNEASKVLGHSQDERKLSSGEPNIGNHEIVLPSELAKNIDPEVAKLIEQQFTPTDIAKICDIANLSESLNNGNVKTTEDETQVKAKNVLSPKSFDFLNSIQGKPTGRDLSRESLYVKFDPLVQPSTANSLIDFTKEVEALAAPESSPAHHSSSICEELLAISPEKKSDVIVPPLTPLSDRNKKNTAERQKDLQNEIYFLKNLYSERERINKTKMEAYESQIAKLTGDKCVLEDKLKEYAEREKSIVKKMTTQTRDIEQLKVVMKEYVKVISVLTAELETTRKENAKEIETLTAEKESYVNHLLNTEAAFSDVHTKYEKSKKTIESLKVNEVLYRKTIEDHAQKMEEYKKKSKEAQEKAVSKFENIMTELQESKNLHSQEVSRLRAQLKKTELKLEALQESLDQKIKENQQLTAICDELIEGKK